MAGDAVALNPSGTLKLTVITHPTYSSSNNSDEAGFTVAQLNSTSTTSGPQSSLGTVTFKSFQSGSTQTIEEVTIMVHSSEGTRPGLYFGMKRALLTDTFNITGRLLIGINKT